MKNWIKRHPILLLCTVFLFTPAALNYSGFCMAEGRWLSDKERIQKEIDKIVGHTQNYIMDGPDGSRLYDVIPYASISEFKQKNPECCSIRYVSPNSLKRVMPMLLGQHSGAVVTIEYTQRMLDHGKIIHIPSGPAEYNMRLQTDCGNSFHY